MLNIGQDVGIDGCAVLRPEGELDAFTATPFRRAIADMATSARLVIDLSEVAFIDSAGLGALVGGIRRTRELGGQVSVSCNRPGLLRVLRNTGFDTFVTVADTLDEAVWAVEASPHQRSGTQ